MQLQQCCVEASNVNYVHDVIFYCCSFHSGQGDVRIGAKEVTGNKNDASLVRFTDGGTHDYIPPDISLDDGNSCLRLFSGKIGDNRCSREWSFICMSEPMNPKGIQ